MSCDDVSAMWMGVLGRGLKQDAGIRKVTQVKFSCANILSTSELSTSHTLQWYSCVSCVWQSRKAWEVTVCIVYDIIQN